MRVCGLKRSDFSYFLHRSEVTQYMCVNFIFDVILCFRKYYFYKSNHENYCTIFIVR